MRKKVFLVGATGGVGSRLAPLLLKDGFDVTGTCRTEEQADALREQRIKPCRLDLMEATIESLTDATEAHDIIVFSAGAAGSGAERTTAIDGLTPVKLIAAANNNAIKRMVLVSAFMDAGRGEGLSEGFEHYMATKRQADAAVTASKLDWVIVRPGTLSDEDGVASTGSGKINAGHAIPYGSIARANVAQTLAELIRTPSIKREIIEITDGNTPVSEAVAAFKR